MNFGKITATLNCQFKIFMTMFPKNNLKHTKLMFQVEKWQEISGRNFSKDFSSYLFFLQNAQLKIDQLKPYGDFSNGQL